MCPGISVTHVPGSSRFSSVLRSAPLPRSLGDDLADQGDRPERGPIRMRDESYSPHERLAAKSQHLEALVPRGDASFGHQRPADARARRGYQSLRRTDDRDRSDPTGARTRECTTDELPVKDFLRREDERPACELGERHAPSTPTRRAAVDRDERLVPELIDGESAKRTGRHVGHNGRVERAGSYPLDEEVGAARVDDEADPRCTRTHVGEDPRDETHREARRCAERDVTAELAVTLRELALERIRDRDDRFRARDHEPAAIRRNDLLIPSSRAMEQRLPDFRLEPPYRMADRRLRCVDSARRYGEAPGFDAREEIAEIPEFHDRFDS